MNCPNCGAKHENKESWYCKTCEARLSRLGLETSAKKSGNA